MEWIKDYKMYVIAAVVAVLFLIFSSSDSQEELTVANETVLAMDEQTEEEKTETPADEPLVLMADIKGAVNQPGVYEIQEGNRVVDLVELAGGLAAEADVSTINFAMRVTDEMTIYIPKKGESVESVNQIEGGEQSTKKTTVNLNRADASELETLPGIGPSKAEAIIEYRETNGSFKSIEDLKSISGIGDKTFEKLKELISVR
jgi:competence protein ComEA